MDLITVFRQFPDEEACYEHLEDVRWGDCPKCPYCNSTNVARKVEKGRIGRWNCHACKDSFNVLQGTIFQGTHIPLQKWFLGIAIMINAKKSLSSCQLARDLDMPQKSAYTMQMRIRKGMVDDGGFLTGIVEADEVFLATDGSRKHDEDDPPKRGRGTKQLPVVGAVSRGGKVVAKPSPRVTAATLKAFLSKHIKADDSVLITDEFKGYNRMNEWVPHFTINHAVQYVEGLIHTNTIESFWSLVKRAIFGSHHHYSREHAAAYIIEACYKYNNRNNADTFGDFISGAVSI